MKTLIQSKPTWKASLVMSLLARVQAGQILVTTPTGEVKTFKGPRPGPSADIKITDWRAIDAIFSKGDIGLAEAFRDNMIQIKDIGSFIHFACLNEDILKDQLHGNFFGTLLYRLKHLFNRNTKKGSRRNILAHYDLGNEFYQLWLDKTMTYSSALFKADGVSGVQSLEQGQIAKYERILQRLGAGPGTHILEIGCGWGGFLDYAVSSRGCRVSAVTISDEQHKYCQDLIKARGYEGKADVSICDYRDIRGQYDAVVSIEMIEAVGLEFWPAYFKAVQSALKEGGQAIIQGIIIQDELFEKYSVGTDFIQQFIFPGGMLLCVKEMKEILGPLGMKLSDSFHFGLSYAETLRRWHATFDDKLEKIRPLGFDDNFIKLWKFYLGYCEGAFRSGRIDVGHYHLVKKGKA